MTVVAALLAGKNAWAEKSLAKDADWEVFTDGRAGAFFSYVRGDSLPRIFVDADGHTHDVMGGGLNAFAEPPFGTTNTGLPQGRIEGTRVQSGFIGNTMGFGVRGPSDRVNFTAYIQLWFWVESDQHKKGLINYADMRQGYAKVEGGWGSFLAGKTRALFSRGATDINVLYAHRFGVGYPGDVDAHGPTQGHVGFGVLGSGFSTGLIYATPLLGGLQLTVGAFDPIQLAGVWTRTKWLRPEAELTFERPLGTFGKVVLFVNGAYQPLYKIDVDESTAAGGFGYGGRLEIGRVHLGGAGHYGKGLGLKYALEPGDATTDTQTNLRLSDGYYVQGQLALGSVDLNAGWGITRIFLNANEVVPDAAGDFHSVIKHQMGFSAAIVYHARQWLHFDLDGFRSEAAWFLGEKQIVYTVSSGMTFTW